jgi:hypothetical protein
MGTGFGGAVQKTLGPSIADTVSYLADAAPNRRMASASLGTATCVRAVRDRHLALPPNEPVHITVSGALPWRP